MPRDVSKHWPSVIDALLHNEDCDVRGFAEDAFAVEKQVIRNLETLLNTRRRPKTIRQNLRESNQSVVVYGIPDFSCSGFDSDRNRRDLCRELKLAIRAFEPRLTGVVVQDLNENENLDRVLRFRISGDLQVYPSPHRVVFDSRLDRATSVFRVTS